MIYRRLLIILIPKKRSSGGEPLEDRKNPNNQNRLLLVKRMKQTDPSPKGPSGMDWRVLGEIELRIGKNTDGAVREWIAETLSPLNLHLDFLNKILKSAQEAVARAMPYDGAATAFEHVHLLVLAPLENNSMGKTWGFFRIDKVGKPNVHKHPYDHSIEFYLYLEG
jgi:hypothetical protein